MASAVPKSANNQEIVDYMETLSKQYFSKVFPDPTISIEAKPKCGKQGGHIVQIRPREVDSPNINIEKFYVKPQDGFVIPSVSSLPSKLADVDELFIYKFLYNFNIGQSVHFYISQDKPECLLIATADCNNKTNENFHTLSHCSTAELKLITLDDIVFMWLIEIIFCLKDLLSNGDNFGWLYPTKRLSIIDFAMDKNDIVSSNPTLAFRMIHDKLSESTVYHVGNLMQNYSRGGRVEKESAVRQVLEKFNDSFIQALEAATQEVDDFVVSYPFGFNDRSNEMTRTRLEKYSKRSRGRFNDLLKDLKIKK